VKEVFLKPGNILSIILVSLNRRPVSILYVRKRKPEDARKEYNLK
jgi:hypothetical protein